MSGTSRRKVDLSFRVEPEIHQALSDLAHERRTSMQKLLRRALDPLLSDRPDIPQITLKEQRFLDDMLAFYRHGDREAVELAHRFAVVQGRERAREARPVSPIKKENDGKRP